MQNPSDTAPPEYEGRSRAFWKGVRDAAPFVLIVLPLGVLFGVVATEAGLDIIETLAMSVLVIAGAAQFAAVQMIPEQVPTLVIILTASALNLRMVMYSAALTPHLGRAPVWQRMLVAYSLMDQTFALSVAEFEARPARTTGSKMTYYAGSALLLCPLWYAGTLIGAVFGKAIPDSFALDFAIPIAFLAMVAPAMRSLPHLAAAVVAVAVALIFAFMPYNLGLMIAAVLGMVAGAQTELAQTRARIRNGG